MRRSRFRACPLCEAICGLELQFEGDELIAIRGDAADPFSHGHVCPKGNAILDLETDPDRLRRPLRRFGEEWREIGWDEAFAFAAERLAAVRAAHGPAAIGAYLGNPNVHHFGHIAYLPSLLRLPITRAPAPGARVRLRCVVLRAVDQHGREKGDVEVGR